MIAVVDVQIQAANPSMPLYPWRAFAGSPSSLRIRNVPKRIGEWNINRVYVSATYPDGSVKAADCVLTGGVYVCTVEGSDATGTARNGYTVYADGVDENGSPVTGFILGKGDISILEADGTLDPGKTLAYVHLLSAESPEPKDGDVWQVNGSWYIYQDGQAWPIGDDSGLIGQLSAELSAKADKTQLANYELKSSMQNDVSSIVTERELTDWNYPEQVGEYWYAPEEIWIRQHGVTSKKYYVIEPIWNGTGMDNWLVTLNLYEWDEQETQSWQPVSYLEEVVEAPEDTLELDCTFTTEWQETLTFHLTREDENVFGFAMMSDLSAKQDKLTDPQISAIDSVVDERATTIAFDGGSTSTYDWAGEINRQTLVDAGIYDDTEQTWLLYPTTINFGAGVTGIGASAFAGCGTLGTVTIPDSVTSIGASAFSGCDALANVKIGNGLKNVGDYAFQNCSNLGQVTLPANVNSPGVDAFSGTPSYFKLYLEEAIPTFVPGAANYPWGVANTANIITVRSASKEWVEEQAYGKGFVWRNVSVNARLHTCSIYAFNINAMTISTAAASFKVTLNATSYTTARDMYFALTIGNFEQPMTWDTPFDVFEGGSAAAIAPKPNTTNIYHIFEYASGHFMVEKFGAAYDELGDIETILNNL